MLLFRGVHGNLYELMSIVQSRAVIPVQKSCFEITTDEIIGKAITSLMTGGASNPYVKKIDGYCHIRIRWIKSSRSMCILVR